MRVSSRGVLGRGEMEVVRAREWSESCLDWTQPLLRDKGAVRAKNVMIACLYTICVEGVAEDEGGELRPDEPHARCMAALPASQLGGAPLFSPAPAPSYRKHGQRRESREERGELHCAHTE